MTLEPLFTSAIEVGIATAGFSGIVVALGQRARGDWRPADLGRIRLLLESSLFATLLAFVPLVLDGAGVPEPTIWRIGSGLFVLEGLPTFGWRLRSMRELQKQDPSFSPRLRSIVLSIILPFMALQIYNAAALQTGWVFAAAVLLQLMLALLMFVRLIQTSSAPSTG